MADPDQKKGNPELKGSAVNQELKNSMFENVFGYEKKHLPKKNEERKNEVGPPMINTGPMPNLSAGYDGSAMLGSYVSDSAALFPEVILNQVAQTMRASEN